ncbi:MAG TPA: Crp/Fnr family transcriptional regulator [Candidatus Helicobacter avistercoris]|nr:Crp/Fnr family transcriptional regulator [Candidatus Helicobacter avistercoris]
MGFYRNLTSFALLPTSFFAKLQDNITFQTKIQSILNTRLTQTLEVLNQTAFTPLTLRVKNLLLSFHQEIVYITHEEIANHLGSTREAITRILKDLQKQGEITLQRGKILIHSL